MEKYYTVFKCKRCGKETILITGEVSSTVTYGNYISCAHCGNKKLIKIKDPEDVFKSLPVRKDAPLALKKVLSSDGHEKTSITQP